MNKTNISWCDVTWNPMSGCLTGCDYCYARALHNTRYEAKKKGAKLPYCYNKPFEVIQEFDHRLEQPIKRQRSATIFIGSMGDICYTSQKFFDAIMWVIEDCRQHTFMMLTKDPERLGNLLSGFYDDNVEILHPDITPFKNLWVGITATTQDEHNNLNPALRVLPAAHKFISFEPLYGEWIVLPFTPEHRANIELVICGGDSRPGCEIRNRAAVIHLLGQCNEYGIHFHFKQWGSKKHGRTIRGREYLWYPRYNEHWPAMMRCPACGFLMAKKQWDALRCKDVPCYRCSYPISRYVVDAELKGESNHE